MPRHKHLSCRLEGRQTCLLEMLVSLVWDLLDAMQQIFNFRAFFHAYFGGSLPQDVEGFCRKKSHFKIKFYLEDLVFMSFINQQLRETTFQEQAKVKVIRTQSVLTNGTKYNHRIEFYFKFVMSIIP